MVKDVQPDAVVIVSDDQGEWLFDDNMPSLMVYWGESAKVLDMPGYGDTIRAGDVPIETGLAAHLIESLMDADFDIAHSRYMKAQYGGSIGPAGYMQTRHDRPPREFGLPHGYAYITGRIFEHRPVPIVPVFQNTCYPPNQPRPRRCYNFGRALAQAIDAWDSSKRVCVVASGGLSHQVLDEATDQLVLRAIEAKDATALCTVPTKRLQASTSETLNWITAAGACEDLPFHLVDYVPVSRTPAGTGGGWAFAYWL
jgi:3-O-methylgallate 3,4-dioxygenase